MPDMNDEAEVRRRNAELQKRVAELEDAITERKRAEEVVQKAKEYADNIVATVREPVVVLDKDLRVVSAGRTFYTTFMVSPEETEGQLLYDLGNCQWDIPALRKLLEEVLPEKTTIEDYEMVHNFETIGQKTMLLNVRKIIRGEEELILLAIVDITERKWIEKALNDRVEFEKIVASISTSFLNLAPDEIDIGIEDALRTIGEFSGIDRSYLFRLFDDGTKTDNTHEWCAEGIAPQIGSLKELSVADFPWFLGRLNRFKTVHIPSIADLPPGADAEKEILQSGDILSAILVPMVYGGTLVGFIGLDSVRQEKSWSEENIALLRIICEIFVNALERKRAMDAIQSSETRFHAMFEENPLGAAIIDKERKIREVNDAAAALIGRPREEIIGRMCHEFICTIAENDCQIYDHGLTFDHAEGILLSKDRGDVPIEKTATQITIDGDTMILEMFYDITRRKATEEAVRESEEKHRTIYDSSKDAIMMLTHEGRFLSGNPAAVEIFGCKSEKEFISRTSYDLSPQYQPDGALSSEKAKQMIAMAMEKGSHFFEWTHKRMDGKEFPTTVLLTRMELQGRRMLQATVRDITEQKAAETALRESEEKIRMITASANDAIIMMDHERSISYWNKAAERMFDYTEEEVIGKDLHALLVPERFHAGFSKGFKGFKETGQGAALGKTLELAAFGKDSKEFPVELSLSAVKLKGRWNAIGLIRDITERKQVAAELAETNQQLEQAIKQANQMAEEASAANQAKSEFLANMSHEIRTPMNAVLGFSDMLLDTDLDEDQRDYVSTVKRSGDSLLSLINDILDFSKIEAGQLDFEEIDFDPELLVYDVCETVRPRIESKPIEVLCRIGDNIPSMVKGDPTRFRQVLTNLMGNAPKFTEAGEIEISLDIEEEKKTQVKLHAKIRDTGIGIPKGKLSTIFEPFQQADGSTTRKYGGTGLGLAICKHISDLMGGEVWAESRVGKGSIFHFTAWLGKAEEKETRRFVSVSLFGKNALIVDDNRSNLDILRHILESVGMNVVALTNGKDVLPALQKALEEQNHFNLCICDIQMPGISGYDVAKAIHGFKSEIEDLPLIALSSLMEREAKKCEEAGFDGFLSKPIRREKLYKMLERLLGKKKDEELKPKIVTQYSAREDMKHSARILLAEDNPVNQKLAKMMLTKAGYQVEVANNGQEAVEKYTTSPEDFDLIFMDVQMPEMDGIKATQTIREKGFDTIPIVAMTANAMKGDREICLKAGMVDYLAKPIKREFVFEILEKWVFNKNVP